MTFKAGICACGCGQPTSIAMRSNTRYGHVVGQPVRFISGHYGARSGRIVTGHGYAMLLAPSHPSARSRRYVYEHVIVAERAVGRFLPSGAVVHHVNGVKDDNRTSNLAVLQNHSEHMTLHTRLKVLRAGGDPWTQLVCIQCRKPKDKAEFPRLASRISSSCKECRRAYSRARNAARRLLKVAV